MLHHTRRHHMLTVNLAMGSIHHTSMDSKHLMVSINLDRHILDRRNDHKTIGKRIFPFFSIGASTFFTIYRVCQLTCVDGVPDHLRRRAIR